MIVHGYRAPAPIVIDSLTGDCVWDHGGGSSRRLSYVNIHTPGKPELLWIREFKYPLNIEPTAIHGAVLVPTPDNKLHVISANNGSRIAEIKFKEPIMTPVVLRDSIAVLNLGGKRMILRNWCTQEENWRADLNGSVVESLILSDRLFWFDGMRFLRCFDITEGKRIWDKKLSPFITAPVTGSSLGVVVLPENGIIECFDPDSGDRLWSFDANARIRNSPVIVDDQMVFVSADGMVARLQMKSGELVWLQDLECSIRAPLASDGHGLYIGTNDRYLIRLDFETGKIDWKRRVDGPIKAGATLTEDLAVFVSIDYKIYFVEKDSGDFRFVYETEGMLSTRPLICDGRIYVAGEDKNLYCFQFSKDE